VLTTVGLIYMGTGNTRLMRQWGVINSVATITAMAIGLRWGYLGVARAYAIVTVVLVYPAFSVPLKLIGLRFRDIFEAVWRQVLTAAVMAAAVVSLERVPGIQDGLTRVAPLWALTILVCVAALVYLGIGSFVIRATMLDILRALWPAGRGPGLRRA
jgi:hypothetical protein